MVRIQKLIVSPPNESSAMARATSRRIISLSAPGGQPPIGEIREPGTAINLLPRGTTGGYPSHPLLLPARTFLCDRAARAWLAMSQRGVQLACQSAFFDHESQIGTKSGSFARGGGRESSGSRMG